MKRENSRAYQSFQKIFRVRRLFFDPTWDNYSGNGSFYELSYNQLINCRKLVGSNKSQILLFKLNMGLSKESSNVEEKFKCVTITKLKSINYNLLFDHMSSLIIVVSHFTIIASKIKHNTIKNP